MSTAEMLHHGMEAAMALAATYVGQQFRRNRNIGQERDKSIHEVRHELRGISEKMSSLMRDVDQDRIATTLLKEAVHRLELEILRYVRAVGVHK